MFNKLFSKIFSLLITSSAAFFIVMASSVVNLVSYGLWGETDCPEELLK